MTTDLDQTSAKIRYVMFHSEDSADDRSGFVNNCGLEGSVEVLATTQSASAWVI